MQRWRYCVLTGMGRNTKTGEWSVNTPRLFMFTDKGLQEVDIRNTRIGEHDMAARMIAQLGAEGWEMVGTGDTAVSAMQGAASHALYFKRPLEEGGGTP